MKLTGSLGYAIGILLQVANGSDEGPMTAARIARGCRFPPRFLYRILRRLVDAGLLEGTSGPGGGYRLAHSPAELTLFDVVAAVDTPPEPSLLRPVRTSHAAAIDEVNAISALSAERFARDLRRKKLSELVELAAAKPAAARGKASPAGARTKGPAKAQAPAKASRGKQGGEKPTGGKKRPATSIAKSKKARSSGARGKSR